MSQLLVTAIWIALMAGAILVSIATSPMPGDDEVRLTIRISLLFYFAACVSMLRLSRDKWREAAKENRIARQFWSLAWLSYAIHVLLAFHHYHHWSHADAVKHASEISGVGEGIFASHLFTLLWFADVGFWWASPATYVRRPVWIGWALHGFMAFIVFNGAIVYASGPVRWVGTIMFAALAAMLTWRLAAVRSPVAQDRLPS